MKIKDIIDENYQDYKKPSMLIAMGNCDWKCLKEQHLDLSICQNSAILTQNDYEVSVTTICDRYLSNPLTQSIIFGGLEPILQFEEILDFIKYFRKCGMQDDIVIYTGYYPNEIAPYLKQLKSFENIIIKFGRFLLNSEKIYDSILGITLNSKNQFALRIERVNINENSN